jgi:hypothetical protein
VNLSLYEQRLRRALNESLNKLQELQAQRKAAREIELEAAEAQRNLHKMNDRSNEPAAETPTEPAAEPGKRQFVFSSPERQAETTGRRPADDPKYTESDGYDLALDRKSPLKQAA